MTNDNNNTYYVFQGRLVESNQLIRDTANQIRLKVSYSWLLVIERNKSVSGRNLSEKRGEPNHIFSALLSSLYEPSSPTPKMYLVVDK